MARRNKADSFCVRHGEDGRHPRQIITSANGTATIGLRRNESPALLVSLADTGQPDTRLTIAPRQDPLRTISGLDCDKVDARTPEQKAHASESWVKKQNAFKTFSEGPGAGEGFRRPASGPMSSPFGPARKYIGVGQDGQPCEKTSIHRGYDIAIPTGTDIIAPAAGTVTLAEADLYYEGGTVFLDHGAGLISVFMHLSKVDVVAGQTVSQGQKLGESGNTGRTTGPHLHWAVKWRNPASPDRSLDFYIDPDLLLTLP